MAEDEEAGHLERIDRLLPPIIPAAGTVVAALPDRHVDGISIMKVKCGTYAAILPVMFALMLGACDRLAVYKIPAKVEIKDQDQFGVRYKRVRQTTAAAGRTEVG